MNKSNPQSSIIKKFLDNPKNKKCADCNGKNPQWASTKLGVFVCLRCSGFHRGLGTDITFVRSTDLDFWKQEYIDLYSEIDNEIANKFWEANIPSFEIKPNEFTGPFETNLFIKNKYVKKLYVNPKMENPVSLIINKKFTFHSKKSDNLNLNLSQPKIIQPQPQIKKDYNNQIIDIKRPNEIKSDLKLTNESDKPQKVNKQQDLLSIFESDDTIWSNSNIPTNISPVNPVNPININSKNSSEAKINADSKKICNINNIYNNNIKDILNLYSQEEIKNFNESSNESKYTPIDKLQDSQKYNYNMNMKNYAYTHQPLLNQITTTYPIKNSVETNIHFSNSNKKAILNKSCERKINNYWNIPVINKEKKIKNPSPFEELIKFD